MAKKKDESADGADGEKKGLSGKIKLLAMIVPTVLLVVVAVYFLVLAPKSGGSAASGTGATSTDSTDAGSTTKSTESPGKLVAVDPITVNLANGHFLKVGVALQATSDAGEDVSTSKALDAIITEFSGKTVDELATEAGREAAKQELTKTVKKLYEKKVYEIYYTMFVMT